MTKSQKVKAISILQDKELEGEAMYEMAVTIPRHSIKTLQMNQGRTGASPPRGRGTKFP